LNQPQDFSKTSYGSSPSTGKTSGTRMSTRAGSTEMTANNTYNKTHTQGFDKQGFHGGTPPPFNLPMASVSQAGPMGAPASPYGAPFLPAQVMAAHQAHGQMMQHPHMQQEPNSSSSRGVNQASSQAKSGSSAKPYGAPQYWNNWAYSSQHKASPVTNYCWLLTLLELTQAAPFLCQSADDHPFLWPNGCFDVVLINP